MRRSFFAFLLAAFATAACSSADFQTANPGDDGGDDTGIGGDDTSVGDTGRDTQTTDSAKDTQTTDSGSDAKDSTIEPDVVGDGSETSTDSGVGDVVPDADTGDGACDANVCGGCGTLTGAPGDDCGTCGKLACSGGDLHCTGDHSRNACGGCTILSPAPDTACGTCGKVTCTGDNSTTCTEATPAPLTGCGGQCGTAQYQCTGIGVTTCVDPLASPPKPKVGDVCGECGNYACTGSGASTDVTCVGDPSSASSRCTATHFGCDVPTCSVTGVCSYPPSDALCTPTSGNPTGCSLDTCTDVATCPPTGDPEPQIKCGMPVSGCTQKLLNDVDDDGYSTVAGCFLSKSTTADCLDSNANVFPGEATYYPCPTSSAVPTSCSATGLPPGTDIAAWDYNCDGAVTKKINFKGACTPNGTGGCTVMLGGWQAFVPDCGVGGTLITGCTDVGGGVCSVATTPTTQTCR